MSKEWSFKASDFAHFMMQCIEDNASKKVCDEEFKSVIVSKENFFTYRGLLIFEQLLRLSHKYNENCLNTVTNRYIDLYDLPAY